MDAKAQQNRKRWCVILAWLVIAAMPIGAQQTALVGRVITDGAEVRASAGDSYYVVGHFKKGSTVNIVDRFFEWYKITPPPGIYSYVAKNRVDASEDGKTGVITRDRTPVKAASIDGPGKSYRRQGILFKGHPVSIIESEGDAYKIVPPKMAYVFVLVSSVKREEFVPARELVKRPVESKQPEVVAVAKAPVTKAVAKAPVVKVRPVVAASVQPTTTVKTVIKQAGRSTTAVKAMPLKTAKAPIEQVVSQESARKPVARIASGSPEIQRMPDVAGQQIEALPTYRSPVAPKLATAGAGSSPVTARAQVAGAGAAEAALEASMTTTSANVALGSLTLEQLDSTIKAFEQLPLERQPIAELLAAYESHYQNTQLTHTQRRAVLVQIIRLRRNAELAMTLQEISLVQQSLDRVPATVQTKVVASPQHPVTYDAVGQLAASGVYDGTSLPRLYRLVSPSLRTVVYLRPNNKIDTAAMMGRILGVNGPSRYDAALKLRVLEAHRIELLTPQAYE